jgi:uncharacterized lipoprotein YehR (DUF1307 family)
MIFYVRGKHISISIHFRFQKVLQLFQKKKIIFDIVDYTMKDKKTKRL